jgi:hypothetical protein
MDGAAHAASVDEASVDETSVDEIWLIALGVCT